MTTRNSKRATMLVDPQPSGTGILNYHDMGDKVYSYKTVVLERHSGPTIGNVTHYSSTTTRHQQMAGSFTADVRLDNVPQGTTDLLALAIERKAIFKTADWVGGFYWSKDETYREGISHA